MINGLPQKLKMLRMKYNLSQKEVASMLDLSPSVVSGYETGERTPSVENDRLGELLGLITTIHLGLRAEQAPRLECLYILCRIF